MHLSHHDPPAALLAERLRRHGARLVENGSVLVAEPDRAAVRRGA